MISAKILACVAAGGAAGAMGRYVVAAKVSAWLGSHFPFGTLSVNVIGGLVLGALMATSGIWWTPSHELRGLLIAGLLGGFTTFSMFSFELFDLMQRGDTVGAAVYAASSVVLCVLGFYAGHLLLRQFVG